MGRWRSAVELTDSDDSDQYGMSMYDSNSDEQSNDDSDDSNDHSESHYESSDEDDSDEESCYDSSEDDSGYGYYYYGDESEVSSYSEEEEVEEVVVLTRMETANKQRGRSKTSVKKDVIRKPLHKKITKKRSKPVQKKKVSKNSSKPAVQKTTSKQSSKLVQKKKISKKSSKPVQSKKCSKAVQKKITKKSSKPQKKKNTQKSSKPVQKKLSDRPVTFLVFDLETTGIHRIYHRIIEIAVVDLDGGGQGSSFYSLVNPGRPVTNSDIHGITSNMVNRPDVPRMQGLIPNLLRFVRSRQKPRGYTVLVAHNARCFDVPFLANEFKRCSTPIPSNWLFLDTLPLAHEAMKHTGSQVSGRASLQALREHYGIGLTGSAHRAMSDVHSLSEVLQRIAFDLNLSSADLLRRTFTVKDLTVAKLKKKRE